MRRNRLETKDFLMVILILVGVIYTIIRKDMFSNGVTTPVIIDFLYGLVTILLGFVLSFFIVKKTIEKNKGKKYLKYDFKKIDSMDGIEFEALLAEYFKLQGYHVVLTPPSNDYGADLVLGADKEVIIVQAKRYTGHKVGNKAVQEIVAAMPYYKATKAMVVTNSYFTKNAKELAEANNVILWDRKMMQSVFQIVDSKK